jgi:hypothetical protein
MRKPAAPECVIGIDGDLGHAVLREMDHLRIPVGREIYPSQVGGHDISEYPLVGYVRLPDRLQTQPSGVQSAC